MCVCAHARVCVLECLFGVNQFLLDWLCMNRGHEVRISTGTKKKSSRFELLRDQTIVCDIAAFEKNLNLLRFQLNSCISLQFWNIIYSNNQMKNCIVMAPPLWMSWYHYITHTFPARIWGAVMSTRNMAEYFKEKLIERVRNRSVSFLLSLTFLALITMDTNVVAHLNPLTKLVHQYVPLTARITGVLSKTLMFEQPVANNPHTLSWTIKTFSAILSPLRTLAYRELALKFILMMNVCYIIAVNALKQKIES